MQLMTPRFSWTHSSCTTCFQQTTAPGPLAVPPVPVYDDAELVLAALTVCDDAKLLLVAIPSVYDSNEILYC